MTKHVLKLIVVLILGVSAGACGDDSGAASGSGSGGTSGGKAGSGAGSKITAEQAAAGMCPMASGGTMSACTGVEEYSACLQSKCGMQKCYDGDCKGLLACYKAADDPCAAPDCPPTAACQTCIMATVSCQINQCISLLKCAGSPAGGETKAGGACDQLDACCKTQPQAAQQTCMLAASGARVAGGDAVCESSKAAFCM